MLKDKKFIKKLLLPMEPSLMNHEGYFSFKHSVQFPPFEKFSLYLNNKIITITILKREITHQV
jgi:hypothetical protein